MPLEINVPQPNSKVPVILEDEGFITIGEIRQGVLRATGAELSRSFVINWLVKEADVAKAAAAIVKHIREAVK